MGGRVHSPTLVGRVEELQTLEAALNRAADADPAVVLVGGEAGVGKTRLIAELASRHATDGTRMLVGGCVPVGGGALPYAPIVEALRDLFAEVGAVFARSEGNPFFTEELLGSIRAGSNELPATLRDLLRGRIQALPKPASQVLAVVAVAGRPVPHRLLAAVAGRDDATHW